MNRPKIMGIGELVWDLLPDGRQLGGAPVNFAYWCNRLGAEGYPVSAVGSDDLGREAFDRLAATGLDLGYVQHNALPTGRVNVTLSGNGKAGQKALGFDIQGQKDAGLCLCPFAYLRFMPAPYACFMHNVPLPADGRGLFDVPCGKGRFPTLHKGRRQDKELIPRA